MATRKKKGYETLPAKSVMEKIADNLWSLAVKNDCLNTCAVCKKSFSEIARAPHHTEAIRCYSL